MVIFIVNAVRFHWVGPPSIFKFTVTYRVGRQQKAEIIWHFLLALDILAKIMLCQQQTMLFWISAPSQSFYSGWFHVRSTHCTLLKMMNMQCCHHNSLIPNDFFSTFKDNASSFFRILVPQLQYLIEKVLKLHLKSLLTAYALMLDTKNTCSICVYGV